MNTRPQPVNRQSAYLKRRFQRISLVNSLGVIAIAVFALWGWVFEIPWLTGAWFHFPTMKVNTALCFIGSSLSLLLWHWQRRRRHHRFYRIARYGLGAMVTVLFSVSALTLAEYLVPLQFGIDQLFLLQPRLDSIGAAPGRMSPNAAFAFLLTAGSLGCLGLRSPRLRWSQGLAFLAGAIAFWGLCGYLYNVEPFFTLGMATGMSVPTVISFLLLESAILCAVPHVGPMRLLVGKGAGSHLARQLLPLAIVLPILIGSLSTIGHVFELFDEKTIFALSSTISIILFLGLVGWNAYQVNRYEEQQHLTERQLAISQAQFAGILDIAADAIIAIDAQQHIILFNRGAERIFGYAAADVLGQSLSLLLPDRYQENHRRHVKGFSQSLLPARQMGERGAIFGRRKDGTEFPAEASISKLVLHGRVIYTTFLRDITERQQAEQALRQSEERLQLAFEGSGDGLWDWDILAGTVYFSPQWMGMLGYGPTELPHAYATWEQLIHPDDREQVIAHLNAHLQDSSVRYAFDYRLRAKDGTWKWISNFGKVVAYDAQGNPTRMLGTHRDISDRKQAEANLKISEERWQFALEGSKDGVWDWDIPGNTLFYSHRWKETIGYTEAEIGNSLSEWETRIHPEDKAHVLAATAAHAEGHTPHCQVEYRFRCKDGHYIWVLDRSRIISRDQADRPTRIIGTHTDITDRKQADDALRQSEATKQAIITAIPDLLIHMEGDGTYVNFLSDSKFNVVAPNQQNQGLNVSAILPPHLVANRLHHTQLALETRETQVYEQQLEIGHYTSYEEVRIVPLGENDVLVMIRDITDRKQAEAQLRRREADLLTAQRVAHIGNWELDITTREIKWSEELFHFFGFDPNDPEPAYSEHFNYIEPSDRLRLQTCLDEAMTNGTPYELDLQCQRVDGRTVFMEARGAVERDDQGRIIRLIGTALDITDRKAAELELQHAKEKAEAANHAKSLFLANMSHELRTPLNVILGMSQAMSYDTKLSVDQQENLRIIRRSGDYLLSLISDILDLSKIEAGQITFEPTSFDLMAMVHTLRDMFRERANSKGLQFDLEIAPTTPQYITTDAQKLRQTLLNLLSNAIKFTENGGVTLRVTQMAIHQPDSPPTPWLQFFVEDTGAGIAIAEQATIFDAFVQSHTGKTSLDGTGLGLTISRKFVELMGGNLTVCSEPDKGSVFMFGIPLKTAIATDIPTTTERQILGLAPNQTKRRVLVVDDHAENRLVLKKLMVQWGFEVNEVNSGAAAIALVEQWPPDLIWMDLRMPEIDGYETTRQIRATEHGAKMVIIALTAQASKSDRSLALAAGCNDFVSKPFQPATLCAKVQEHLNLQFLYAPVAEAPTVASAIAPTAIAWSDRLQTMPPEWLHDLFQSAQRCDDEEIIDLLQTIPPTQTELAQRLQTLACNFEFKQIMQLVQAATADDSKT